MAICTAEGQLHEVARLAKSAHEVGYDLDPMLQRRVDFQLAAAGLLKGSSAGSEGDGGDSNEDGDEDAAEREPAAASGGF